MTSMIAWRMDAVTRDGFIPPFATDGEPVTFTMTRTATCEEHDRPPVTGCRCGLHAVPTLANLRQMAEAVAWQRSQATMGWPLLISRVVVHDPIDTYAAVRGQAWTVHGDEVWVVDPTDTIRGSALTIVGPCYTDHVDVPAVLRPYLDVDIRPVVLPDLFSRPATQDPRLPKLLDRDRHRRTRIPRIRHKTITAADLATRVSWAARAAESMVAR